MLKKTFSPKDPWASSIFDLVWLMVKEPGTIIRIHQKVNDFRVSTADSWHLSYTRPYPNTDISD